MLKCLAFFRCQLLCGVVVDHLLLDFVDENGSEGARLALVVASRTDEVGVDASGAAPGVSDD